ncbi:MAG: ATP-binding cassette domain-containing protein [Candidatus Methanoperedens sp.]|nr:ATP-binding cassette domain-containing protein [Candidatus Methanoperedens sp.]
MNTIKTIGLEHIYPDGTHALSGVDFEANQGEKIAVLGPNGSGKTTLFYHFNGLVKPTAGEIRVFGENITRNNIDDIRKRIGLVFQESDNQLIAPTVFEDIAFGPKNLGLGQEEIRDRVRDVLHRFNIEPLAQKNPANLSTGQKKRVAIAGVVVMEPEVIVLDEPTSGMDARGAADTFEILDELNNDGKTIILSTHDPNLAASWADRLYLLNKGKVFRSGAPKHIFADEKLVADAGMIHPVIMQTFREFRARGISKGEIPLNVLDFLESVDAKIINIRCAIAGCDLSAGDEVCLEMKEGMLVAGRDGEGLRGSVVFDGRKGEDIAVRDVRGDLWQLAGSITIIRVPGIIEGGSRSVETGKVWEILEKNKNCKTGAMGTSAKVLLGKLGIRTDFEFDVAQSGILAALRGFNVSIFASGGMAERVMEKVKERKIRYSVIEL